jgi:hypothetical protein
MRASPMVKQNKPEFIARAESKQALKSFSPNKGFATVYPDFSYSAVIEMINNDPTARGALNHFVDKCMEGDMVVLNKDSMKFDEAFQHELQRKHKFRTNIIRKVFLMGKLYNNVFIEILKNSDGSLKELNVLDTTGVEAITKPNGDLDFLKASNPDPTTGKYPIWQAEEIVWIKFNDITRGYAPVDMRALWETILLKDYIRRFVSWLWKTGQYRLLYFFKSGSDQDIETFITYLKKNEGNFQIPLILRGEGEIKVPRDIKEIDSIDRLLKYVDNQILIALRIPPSDAGIPDASGRSNADAQSNNLITHITSWKTVVSDAVSHDLFPKIGKENNILKFSPSDRFAEKQVFEVLQLMQSMMMTQDVMKEYLIDKGIVFSTEKWFEDKPEVIGDAASKNPRSKDMAPSRLGKGTGEGNKPQEEVTTRPDQLKKV